jgi:type IV pilus assembly protein PilN
MIRINLLAVERERTKRTARAGFGAGLGAGLGAAQKITIAASVIVVGTALAIVWWFWALRMESSRIDREIADAEAETRRLRGVLTQVQQFEQRKAQLQQRVSLIEELRKGQDGPVHMLDAISRSLPDRLWLTDLQQKEWDIAMKGISTSLTSLSDFVGNLEGSGYFRKPVEIVNSQVESSDKTGDLVKFEVKATFKAPEPAPLPGGAPPAKPAAKPAAR